MHNPIKTKNVWKVLLVLIFLMGSMAAWFGFKMYRHYYITTDNAYINANVARVAPRITGKIVNLYVENNQYVQQGQTLFEIDPEPFQIAVLSAKAQVEVSSAQLKQASITAKRTLALVKTKYASRQEGDNTITSLRTASAQLEYAQASLKQATLNLTYTKITAPVSGWVTNLTMRVGDIIPANQSAFALISDEIFWADANFKEIEMEAIKPGQMATIITDLYPHHQFKGVVESISGGSGTAFSLLPPQNATGNWVKVTQRIPVKIRVLNPDRNHQLRIGISAKVTVHLREASKS